MTVISASGRQICKNHEITKNRNYILTIRSALVDAKQNEMWIDTNGRDHMVTYDNECKDDEDFRPASHFTASNKCW